MCGFQLLGPCFSAAIYHSQLPRPFHRAENTREFSLNSLCYMFVQSSSGILYPSEKSSEYCLGSCPQFLSPKFANLRG
jgi:hypothetical protein